MKLSSAKINYLSHLISQVIEDTPSIDCHKDQNDIRLRIKLIISDEMKQDEEIDRTVKKILLTQSRQIPEGSKEWDVLYEKYYAEETNRRRGVHGGIRRIV